MKENINCKLELLHDPQAQKSYNVLSEFWLLAKRILTDGGLVNIY